jgi:hypothetical protein
MPDERLTVLFPAPADPITLYVKKESKHVRTGLGVGSLDLQNNYVGFGYWNINFVHEDFHGFYQPHLKARRTHGGR